MTSNRRKKLILEVQKDKKTETIYLRNNQI